MVIKVVIHFNLMGCKIRFLNNQLGFNPYLNKEQLPFFNNQLHPGINTSLLVILLVVTIVTWPYIYTYVQRKQFTNVYFEYGYILNLAGVLSALLDKIFFGGSLDYILIVTKIIDLKDIYLFSSVIFMLFYLLSYIKYNKVGQKNKS